MVAIDCLYFSVHVFAWKDTKCILLSWLTQILVAIRYIKIYKYKSSHIFNMNDGLKDCKWQLKEHLQTIPGSLATS